ncbi:MAG: hypothetical protein ACI9K2_006809 [Myxococcota bacterium]|jgi:hypothetical protein
MTRSIALALALAGCTPQVVTRAPAAGYVPNSPQLTDVTRVIVLGDGVSAGVGASSPDLAYASLLMHNDDLLWPGWTGRELGALYPNLDEVIVVSQPGATIGQVYADQLTHLEDRLGPEVDGQTLIIATLGTTELAAALRGEPAGDVESEVDAITAFFTDTRRFPDGAALFVANLHDPTDGVGWASGCTRLGASSHLPWLSDTNAHRRITAQQHGFAVVDARSRFEGHGLYAGDPRLDTWNPLTGAPWLAGCVYPDARGHHELRRLFWRAIVHGEG